MLLKIKPVTQRDTKQTLKDKGVPSRRNKNVRGDHYVTIVVDIPTKLNSKQKKALEAYASEMNRE